MVVDLFHRYPDNAQTEAERERSETALKFLLDCLIGINTLFLRYHKHTASIYSRGAVKYVGEEDTEEWLSIPAILAKGEADCEDLAAARAAELRVHDDINTHGYIDWRKKPSGGMMYHALCWREKIGVNDPPGRKPRNAREGTTERGEKVILCAEDGRPVLWVSHDGKGFVEDPSRVLGMGAEV